MIEIKPNSEEIEYLKSRYNPVIRCFNWEFPNIEMPFPRKGRSASVVLVIVNKNRFIMIKKPYAHWSFPVGEVIDEEVEQAVHREAKKLGLEVEIESMPAINIIEMKFKNYSTRTWYFIFKCKTNARDEDIKIDRDIIEDMRFFSGWDFFFDINPLSFSEWAYNWTKTVLKDVNIIE
ncbi:MAG: NUDIX hydrolase [Methanocellales archaeon]